MIKRLHTDRNASICVLRRAGAEPTDIAAQLGLTRGVVLGVLYRVGLTDKTTERSTRAAYTAEHRQRVLEHRKRHGFMAAVRHWGVAASTLAYWQQGL